MVTTGNKTYHGDYFIMYKNINSLCGTPETNIIMYVNYTSIKKKTALVASTVCSQGPCTLLTAHITLRLFVWSTH